MISKTVFSALAVASLAFGTSQASQPESESSYIIQGASLETVTSAVLAVDGEITHELGIINAVAATLSEDERVALESRGDLHITLDSAVEVAGKPDGGPKGKDTGSKDTGSTDSSTKDTGNPATDYPNLASAAALHAEGITGYGVTIAVLDSGSMSHMSLNKTPKGDWRFVSQYDAIRNEVVAQSNMKFLGTKRAGTGIKSDDEAGHGTHVQSVIVNSDTGSNGLYNGIAPYAYLVSVKAFDDHGHGTYADVIRGIDWVVANQDYLGIDVLNLSLSASPQSHYWDDPLNQAVMRAWQAGIVVVASAGNTGPDPMTIGVPGNVPYVITVGAMSDNYTPENETDDSLASFSAAGPTVEGFVKPEVVAPGGHVVGLMSNSSTIAIAHPEYHDGGAYFTMSGTSQSAAVVSGIAALILEAEPHLTPDQVKCKIISAARPAVKADGSLAYSVFQQGAGVVNAYDAVHGSNYDCANRGLDVNADLAGAKHFGGRANEDANGNYYIMGLEGYLWTDRGVGADGFLWTDGYLWTDGFLWTDGYLWTDKGVGANGYLWTDGGTWTSGYLWTDGPLWNDGFVGNASTETMSINNWVDQE
jgi:subtilisin family serine protease